MASRKRKEKKVAGRSTRSSRPSTKTSVGLLRAMAVLLALVFAAGQWLVFKGNLLAGLTLSLLASAAGFAIYYFRLDPSSWFEKKKLLSMAPPPDGTQHPLKGESSEKDKPLGVWRGAGLVAAFVLAGIGQFYLIQSTIPTTLTTGLVFYGAAAFLLIVCLIPWFRERMKWIPMDFRLEMILLGLCLLLAVFLRVYRIDTIPSGLFIDQGFAGNSALRILNEGWRPVYQEDLLHAFTMAFYMLAGWFKIFGASEVSLRLFYVFLGVAALPLIYWTFRQLAGPRMALLSLFILAVMRWHINFSRNAFPSIQLPLYIFGTIAFLLYGLEKRKSWPFLVATVFFSAGFYTYQAYKIFPVLLLLLFIYECSTRLKVVASHWRSIVLFVLVSLSLLTPVFRQMIKEKGLGTREEELSIFSKVQEKKSLRPVVDIVSRTALMFNRQGDTLPRHNLQNHRMLDDVMGALFLLGLAYSLVRIKRRKYFYAISGLLVMSLPCLLSTDPAHANRMMGVTPFLAFLAAVPIAAVWGRVLRTGRQIILWGFLGIVAAALAFMTYQNFQVYFIQQAQNFYSWSEYDVVQTTIGREIAKNKDDYEYVVTPEYYSQNTVQFLGYFHRERIHNFHIPDDLTVFSSDNSRGLYFFVEENRPGLADAIRNLYPEGVESHLTSRDGKKMLFMYRVPREVAEASRGLKGTLSGVPGEKAFPLFPDALPPGPYHAEFHGCLFLNQSSRYTFEARLNGKASLWVAGKRMVPGRVTSFPKGFYSIRLSADFGPGKPDLTLTAHMDNGGSFPLGPARLSSLPLNRGLRSSYFPNENENGKAILESWDPVVDYVNGSNFAIGTDPISVRWEGVLNISEPGPYLFSFRTTDSGRILVDGKLVDGPGPEKSRKVNLTAGPHSIVVHFVHPHWTGAEMAALYWIKAGTHFWEPVPFRAFGETRPDFPAPAQGTPAASLRPVF